MSLLTVALLGPTGVGKTTLAVALQRGDTSYDAMSRGGVVRRAGRTITIRDRIVRCGDTALIDTPGHPGFFRIACVSLALADVVVWLVDGNDSVMPHGRMLLRAARGLRLRHVVPFVPRSSDDVEIRDVVHQEIGELVDGPVLTDDVAALEAYLAALPRLRRDEAWPLELPIQRVYTRHGNSVVVGRIARGTVRLGDELELVGLTRRNGMVRVAGLQTFGANISEAKAGDLVAVRLPGVFSYTGWAPWPEDLVVAERGKALVTPGSAAPTDRFVCDVDLFTPREGGRRRSFGSGFAPQFLLGTADVTGVCDLNGDAEPGAHVPISVTLRKPVVVHEGMPFLLLGETPSAARGLVGTGKVTNVPAPLPRLLCLTTAAIRYRRGNWMGPIVRIATCISLVMLAWSKVLPRFDCRVEAPGAYISKLIRGKNYFKPLQCIRTPTPLISTTYSGRFASTTIGNASLASSQNGFSITTATIQAF